MKVFDARITYDTEALDDIMREDKIFTGGNHHWALAFHKCLPKDIINAGLCCNKAWLTEVEPEEVRTKAANITDLDRGTFKL